MKKKFFLPRDEKKEKKYVALYNNQYRQVDYRFLHMDTPVFTGHQKLAFISSVRTPDSV